MSNFNTDNGNGSKKHIIIICSYNIVVEGNDEVAMCKRLKIDYHNPQVGISMNTTDNQL